MLVDKNDNIINIVILILKNLVKIALENAKIDIQGFWPGRNIIKGIEVHAYSSTNIVLCKVQYSAS